MKVLLVNGSPRKNGNTDCALEECAAVLGQEGIETEIIWIGAQAIRGCTGLRRLQSATATAAASSTTTS